MTTSSDNFAVQIPCTEDEMLAIASSLYRVHRNKPDCKERMLNDAELLQQCADTIIELTKGLK